MGITAIPTLAFMADVYRRSPAGGPRSERFAAYVGAAARSLPVHGYNPMTTKAVLPTVEALLAVGAEERLVAVADAVAARLGHDGDGAMHFTVATPGMWTDRLATEVHHRLGAPDPEAVLWWHDEPVDAAAVEAEIAAQAVRMVLVAARGGGPPATLAAAVEQEGLAVAMAGGRGELDAAAAEALEVLGADPSLSTMVAFLYGDDAARAMGFTPLGLGDRVGYRHAAALAAAGLRGAGAALPSGARPPAEPSGPPWAVGQPSPGTSTSIA